MSQFVRDSELNSSIQNIIENAQDFILLISPYIKLHKRLKSALEIKKDNPDVKIVIVFGKNTNDYAKSFNKEDFLFLKDFPNIEIRHEERLHAKFYANDKESLITSMNLYEFSQNNNIEAGIIVGDQASNDAAYEYFNNVINQAKLLYQNEALFEKINLGLSKRYINSEIKVDKLSRFFKLKKGTKARSIKKQTQKTQVPTGYCIRTGKKIPFNVEKPFCNEAYKSWSKYSNKDYKEKYCHFSGEPSNGKTSFNKPILSKNWKKAKAIHKF